jgi:glucosamine--fructose-6-phosphate aminotransferase (isomerizing)
MILAKNGSPLIIGVGQGQMFVASEPAAFGQYTKEFIALEDGETAIITSDSHSLDRSRIELAPYEKIEVSPAPWPHWTIKEIFEQPEALARALNYGGRFRDEVSVKLGGLDANLNILKGVRHLVIAACGTSFYSGLAGAQYMRLLNAFETVQVIDAAEVAPQNLPSANGALLVISQSGETKDVHRALQMALDNDMPSLSIVNVVGSLIARTTHCGVYLNAGREHAVASTKAFTSSCTVLAMIAVWFAQIGDASDVQKRRAAIDALHRLPTNVGMTLRVRDQCKAIAKYLANEQHIFILGKGHALPIAMEGALKIKEISYIHAEGYPGGALKHGPYALITEGTPIILIILNDRHAGLMQIVAEEVKSRGAKTIVITDLNTMRNDSADFVIKIPSNGVLTNILAVIPLQLIAYETSVLKGIDPDRPKNLAKAVTVD